VRIYRRIRKGISNAGSIFRRNGLKGVAETAQKKLKRRSRQLMEFGIRRYLLPLRIRHVHGPEEISYGPNDLLVISVVRNGAVYIRSFMEHYLSLGVKHFVFLDNGSTDGTLEKLKTFDNATLVETKAPYRKYENTMKRYLAERFSRGRWHLCADIDEYFNYPCADRLSLRDFLRYLNHNNYTAVATQMLDRFSDLPFSQWQTGPDYPLAVKFPYYDISAISKTEYLWSPPSNRAIKFHSGGIRKMVFGTDTNLTKSPLVFMDGRVKTFVAWHHVQRARMADISCVFMHYPFVSSFSEKVEDAARTGRYGAVSTDDYRTYAEKLRRTPDFTFMSDSAQRFTGIERLIENAFLIVSEKYERWVSEHAQQQLVTPIA
jgi:Glycosyl transferase family 2